MNSTATAPNRFFSARKLEVLAAVLLLGVVLYSFFVEWRIWSILDKLNTLANTHESGSAFWKNLLWKKHPFLLMETLGLAGAFLLLFGKRTGWHFSVAAAALLFIQFARLVRGPGNPLVFTETLFLAAGIVIVLLLLLSIGIRLRWQITSKDARLVILLLLLLMLDKWWMLRG